MGGGIPFLARRQGMPARCLYSLFSPGVHSTQRRHTLVEPWDLPVGLRMGALTLMPSAKKN